MHCTVQAVRFWRAVVLMVAAVLMMAAVLAAYSHTGADSANTISSSLDTEGNRHGTELVATGDEARQFWQKLQQTPGEQRDGRLAEAEKQTAAGDSSKERPARRATEANVHGTELVATGDEARQFWQKLQQTLGEQRDGRLAEDATAPANHGDPSVPVPVQDKQSAGKQAAAGDDSSLRPERRAAAADPAMATRKDAHAASPPTRGSRLMEVQAPSIPNPGRRTAASKGGAHKGRRPPHKRRAKETAKGRQIGGDDREAQLAANQIAAEPRPEAATYRKNLAKYCQCFANSDEDERFCERGAMRNDSEGCAASERCHWGPEEFDVCAEMVGGVGAQGRRRVAASEAAPAPADSFRRVTTEAVSAVPAFPAGSHCVRSRGVAWSSFPLSGYPIAGSRDRFGHGRYLLPLQRLQDLALARAPARARPLSRHPAHKLAQIRSPQSWMILPRPILPLAPARRRY